MIVQVNVVSYKARPNAKDFVQVEIVVEKNSQKIILIGKVSDLNFRVLLLLCLISAISRMSCCWNYFFVIRAFHSLIGINSDRVWQ